VAGYGSDTGAGSFTDWIAENGYTTGSDDDLTVAQLRQRGSDYIDALYGQRFRGEPAGGIDQERAWPRVNATFWKASVPADAIPRNVVIASYHAALHEAQNPGSLAAAARSSEALKRKKIDTIEREYFEGSGNAAADATIKLSAVEGLLAPFLLPEVAGSGLGVWSVG
jgi:hypothetical protein